MMQYIPEDYRTVCLDVKDPRDFEGAGTEIPIYIENKTDPLMLKQLLEQESHLWLRRELPELVDLCKEGDPFEKVLERVQKRMEEKVHPVVRDRLKVLRLLLKNLVNNMAKVEISNTLELPSKNNVMDLSKAPAAIKQLAVYSTIKWVQEKQKNVVLVIDELPDFAPQQYRTPSKNMIGQAIRKGGAKGIWLWLSGQTMTGVDKQVLKQAMIWILGHQREINEAKRTLDQIPFKTGLSVEDIMTLPVGNFVVCTDEGAYITYVQPEGVDDNTARQVSLNQISVNSVIETLKKEKKDDEDLVYKEKCEQLEKKLREEQIELSKTQEEKALLEKNLENAKKFLELADEKLEPYEEFVDALRRLLGEGTQIVQVPSTLPSEQTLNLEASQLTINVKHTEEPKNLTTTNQQGQMMYVAIHDLPREGFTEQELGAGLVEHGWTIPSSSLHVQLAVNLIKDGLVVRIPDTKPARYRLPSKVKVNVVGEGL